MSDSCKPVKINDMIILASVQDRRKYINGWESYRDMMSQLRTAARDYLRTS